MKRQPVWRQVVALLAAVVLGTSETAEAGTSITFNGTSYTVPAIGDASWGSNVSTYLIAIASGALQKSGGTFTLTAETDFGATYGLKAPYFKSKTATIAAAGVLRMGNNGDSVSWRNAANGADLALIANASDRLSFNSVVVPGISTTDTLTNKTMSGSSNTFTNLPATGLTGIVPAANGGTGVANNAASTLTISGSFGTTLTVTGSTGVTLPTTGTLATLAGTEALTNKTVNKVTLTAPASAATITVADGKTLTASNTLTFTGTDSSSVAFGAGGTVVYTGRTISTTAPITGGGDLSSDRTIAIPASTGTANGYLSSTDWTTFNSIAKVAATGTVNGYLSSTDWTTFNSIAKVKATGTVNGYLSSTDWTTFNSISAVKATATVNGYLSSTDWTQFNSGVTGVKASASANGYLSSTDWTTFNNGGRAATSAVSGSVSYEDSGTFTETFAGPRTQTQHTWTYSRVGKQVTIYWPTDTAATCGVATIFTGGSTIPSGIIPTTTVIGQVWVEDNGAFPDAPGIINVSSAGAITVSKSNSTANFTASGACTFFRGSFTYTVN